jgi:hypothetical protein
MASGKFLRQRLCARIAQHLSPVELAKIYRLRRIAVGFGPTLADFVNHPGGHQMLALAQERGDAKEQVRALLCGRLAPRLECLVGGLDGAAREFLRGLLKAPDHLRFVCRIKALKLPFRIETLAAYDQRVFAPQLALDLLNRRAHQSRVLCLAEIRKRLIAKFALHNRSS